MARPLVVVKDRRSEGEGHVAGWRRGFPGLEFLEVADGKALLRELSAQKPAALIFAPSGAKDLELLSEIARCHPALPVLVFGAEGPSSSRSRPGPVMLVTEGERDAAEAFLRDDVSRAARGSLSGVALAGVLQVLLLEQRTCSLRVRAGHRSGSMVVRCGALISAEYRDLSPEEAAMEMITWLQVDVSFSPAPPPAAPAIRETLDFLLLEAARRLDERAAAGKASETVRPPAARSPSDPSIAALGGADALLEAVMRLPGACGAEVVDIERGVSLARRALDGERPVSVEFIASLARSAFDMAQDLDSRDWMEEIFVQFSSRFKVLRPMRAANLVLCTVFDRKVITLGMARTKLAVLLDDSAGLLPQT